MVGLGGWLGGSRAFVGCWCFVVVCWRLGVCWWVV